jgi:hypothetical protein
MQCRKAEAEFYIAIVEEEEAIKTRKPQARDRGDRGEKQR